MPNTEPPKREKRLDLKEGENHILVCMGEVGLLFQLEPLVICLGFWQNQLFYILRKRRIKSLLELNEHLDRLRGLGESIEVVYKPNLIQPEKSGPLYKELALKMDSLVEGILAKSSPSSAPN